MKLTVLAKHNVAAETVCVALGHTDGAPLPAFRLHYESFGGALRTDDRTITLHLLRSNVTFEVTVGTSILDALLEHDIWGELMTRLGTAFRDLGYQGATLSLLAEATGLQKASLYHRFPGDKEQMAREVLEAAQTWIDDHILGPLRSPGDPATRVAAMAKKVDEFYAGGRQACLLNMLSSGRNLDGPFSAAIKGMFQAWISALAAVAMDAGADKKAARIRRASHRTYAREFSSLARTGNPATLSRLPKRRARRTTLMNATQRPIKDEFLCVRELARSIVGVWPAKNKLSDDTMPLISRAALWPGAPVTPPPGWVPAPHMYPRRLPHDGDMYNIARQATKEIAVSS